MRYRKTWTLPALALVLAGAAPLPQTATPVAADKGGPIAPADIMRLHDMRDVEMSPDGRTILFTVQPQMATFGPDQRTIWSVPTDGSAPARRFVTSAGADDTPRWSPDGRSIAFLSNRKNPLTGGADTGFEFKPDISAGPGAPVDATPPTAPVASGEPSRQLWVIARDGGEATPLTALPGDIADFAWSPDGTRIAFLSADPDTPAEKAERAAKRDWVEMDKTRHVTRLWILDLAAHAARRVSPANVSVSNMAWSPDGKRMAVRVTDTTAINDYFYHSRIALFDPISGAVGKTLIEHAAEGPLWSPDGTAILGSEIRTPGFIGIGARVYDLTTDTLSALADDHPGLLTQVRWSADSRSIVALSFEQTRSKLVRVARATGRVTPLAQLDGEASDVTASRDGRHLAISLSSPDRPADVWTLDGARLRPITTINPQVATWKLGQVRQISWTNSRDGQAIHGVLVTPPGYVPGTPIKTVVQGHGGPEWAWWSGWLGSWHEWAQMLATHGYAVLLPNPRGSDGQGTAFARAVGNDWGGMDYQDVLDGVDMLVAQKIADPARLGIGGWSYGGFLSAWAVTHGDRFKAAVVGAGPTDMTAMARITDTPDFTTGYFGEPSAHLADLDRVSSIRLLDKVHTPVLVLHGEQDTRVPVTLGLEFYRGLKLLRKPAEMVRYPREPHWFHEPEHQADIQRRVLAWFDAHL
ncbi:S9 family peptidase [Sphingomonas sp. CFBP 13728]|uniref:alpha/beta fold hydrolase n=1 Tax=Sphingomonas sp. CFBP 13728 TaxID=2775294 RepID=UPI00177A7642|nr:S9 family peptidase [Sphingomonas sp. CFBP 13728]